VVAETERLMLREFVEGDVQAYYSLGSNLAVTRYTGSGHLTSLEHALEVLRANPLADYREHGFGRWACVLKSSSKVIGFAGLKRLVDLNEIDVAFWLLPAYWGQGLATEAGRAALDYGFGALQLHRIIGLVDPANVASARVLEKLGMTRDGLISYQSKETIRYVAAAGSRP
jgi:RimJ/RimL family protein N-acetyltransferase